MTLNVIERDGWRIEVRCESQMTLGPAPGDGNSWYGPGISLTVQEPEPSSHVPSRPGRNTEPEPIYRAWYYEVRSRRMTPITAEEWDEKIEPWVTKAIERAAKARSLSTE